MLKKFIVLCAVLLLTMNVTIMAVNYSSSVKYEYQKKFNNILTNASIYVNLSSLEKAEYQKIFNEYLNGLEELINTPEVPESAKAEVLNDLNKTINEMEKELNNPQYSAEVKAAAINKTLSEIKTNYYKQKADQLKEQNELKKAEQERLAKEKKFREDIAMKERIAKEKQQQLEQEQQLKIKKEQELYQTAKNTLEEKYSSVSFYNYKDKNPIDLERDRGKDLEEFCASKGGHLPSMTEIADVMSVAFNTNIDNSKNYFKGCQNNSCEYIPPMNSYGVSMLAPCGGYAHLYSRDRKETSEKSKIKPYYGVYVGSWGLYDPRDYFTSTGCVMCIK